jgi:hypothetical protein
MARMHPIAAVALLALVAPLAPGAPPGPANPLTRVDPIQALLGEPADALAGSLRGQLVRLMPTTLYEASPGWGRQDVPDGALRWLRRKEPKNDGTWRRIKVETLALRDSLVLDIREAAQPQPGKLTFTTFLSFDARAHMDQEKWRNGVKLYDTSTRVRFRARLTLQCEVSARLEKGSSFVPDMVLRFRVAHAAVRYDNVVVEHIAGLGGEAAQLLGDAVKGGLRKWHPTLEAEMLAKANAAIEKAADTKEVRISLAKVLNQTKPK